MSQSVKTQVKSHQNKNELKMENVVAPPGTNVMEGDDKKEADDVISFSGTVQEVITIDDEEDGNWSWKSEKEVLKQFSLPSKKKEIKRLTNGRSAIKVSGKGTPKPLRTDKETQTWKDISSKSVSAVVKEKQNSEILTITIDEDEEEEFKGNNSDGKDNHDEDTLTFHSEQELEIFPSMNSMSPIYTEEHLQLIEELLKAAAEGESAENPPLVLQNNNVQCYYTNDKAPRGRLTLPGDFPIFVANNISSYEVESLDFSQLPVVDVYPLANPSSADEMNFQGNMDKDLTQQNSDWELVNLCPTIFNFVDEIGNPLEIKLYQTK